MYGYICIIKIHTNYNPCLFFVNILSSNLDLLYRVLKNYVYNISGMMEEVKTNMFFI